MDMLFCSIKVEARPADVRLNHSCSLSSLSGACFNRKHERGSNSGKAFAHELSSIYTFHKGRIIGFNKSKEIS